MQEESKQVSLKEGEESSEDKGDDEKQKSEIDEFAVGKGLGNSLKMLRQRGLLGKQLIRGRNMDRTLEA